MNEILVHLISRPKRGRQLWDTVSIRRLMKTNGTELPCPFTDRYRFRDIDELVKTLIRYFGATYTFRLID